MVENRPFRVHPRNPEPSEVNPVLHEAYRCPTEKSHARHCHSQFEAALAHFPSLSVYTTDDEHDEEPEQEHQNEQKQISVVTNAPSE
jgi:hypothetical protein